MTTNVFFISQHNLGIGDYAQIKKIANSLSLNHKYKVWHFSGGIKLNDEDESNVIHIQLPIISRIKPESGDLQAKDEKDITLVHRERAELLLRYFKKEKPALIITGFFPFSKHRLEGTVLPLLKYAKKYYPDTKIVSSIRDIPVSDHGPFLEDSHLEVNEILKEFYQGVFHHTDPKVIHCSSIPFMSQALDGIKIFETGFISFMNKVENKSIITTDYLITVGGGWDGRKVIEMSCNEIRRNEPKATITVICGPRMPKEDMNFIRNKFRTLTVINKVDKLEEYFIKSKVVISMAGCSTVPEIVKYKKPCVLIPRGKSYEQILRAKAYEKAGCLVCHELENEDSLYDSINRLKDIPLKFNINVEGESNTLTIIENILLD